MRLFNPPLLPVGLPVIGYSYVEFIKAIQDFLLVTGLEAIHVTIPRNVNPRSEDFREMVKFFQQQGYDCYPRGGYLVIEPDYSQIDPFEDDEDPFGYYDDENPFE